MSESAQHTVVTVEFVITGNGVWCEVLHCVNDRWAGVSGQVFRKVSDCALMF